MPKKIEIERDSDGKIKPSPEDYDLVRREHPNESPAKKHQLAQAAALIRWYENTK